MRTPILLSLVAAGMLLASCGDGGLEAGAEVYCDVMRTAHEHLQTLADVDITDPAEAESAFTQLIDLVGAVRDAAPGGIRDDAQRYFQSLEGFVRAFEAADWDSMELDPEAAMVFQDPDVIAAQANLNEYNSDVCGIDTDS